MKPLNLNDIDGFPDVIDNKRLAHTWLTAREAADYLGVRPATLLKWVRSGKVPGHRLSGMKRCVWRFLRSELDGMLFAPSVCPERTEHEKGTTV